MSSVSVKIIITIIISLFGLTAYAQPLDLLDSDQAKELFHQNLDKVLELKAEQDLLEQKKNVRLLQMELADLTNKLDELQDASLAQKIQQDYKLIAAMVKPKLTAFVLKHLAADRLFNWDSNEQLVLDDQKWDFSTLGKLGVKIMDDKGQAAWILY